MDNLYKRTKLVELLAQCTEPQKNLFNRMYKSPEQVTSKQLDWALQQVDRTVQENKQNNVKIPLTPNTCLGKLKSKLDKLLKRD